MKLLLAIRDIIFLNDYKKTLQENDLLEKHRLTLYKTVTFLFLLVYLSFILMYRSYSISNKILYYCNHFLFITSFINYILLNKTKNSKLTYSYSILLFFALLHIITYKSGGIENSGNAYLLCVILYTFMLLGKKAGLLFALVTILNFGYFYYISEYTNLIDNSLNDNEPSLIKIDYLVTLILSVFFIWSQSRFLQLTHNEIVESILQSSKKIIEDENEKVILSRMVAENELKALRAQMNPHFTFNVMNSIQYYLSNNETETAQIYLTKFSSLIRKVLDNSKKSLVLLNVEIEALQIYLELEQMRFKEKFTYHFNIDNEVKTNEWYIPSMLIQPFVENCIKHGFAQGDYNGIIQIDFKKITASTFQCIITDNGIGREKAKAMKVNNLNVTSHISYGLQIANDRIKVFNTMHNCAAFIKIINIENDANTGTTVIIELPIMED
jgi:sensor histidine kinase YesM